ncbi:hypothetical protein Tsubulata_039692 [Turnera subulata]|uniref:DUF4283 domain-containing protein n=1 Tax=Turnera subulata TaxID=218843 RepID=A0A9Q0G4T6_9ROSI|nr:hypothetical protein Tsubulata_039692 [Turnera subulata]
MGLSPKLGLIQAMATKLWGRYSPISVIPYTEGLYLFQFFDESALSRALYGGPWHIGGIPLLLRKWTAEIKPVDFSASLIPVWVQLKQVPFELLTKEGLSYLASAIGKPSHMNQDCSKMLASDRVSVCVDVDFSKPLLDELTVEFDGCQRTIPLSYSWKPQFCVSCNKWGHHQLTCSTKRTTVQWVPKATSVVSPTTDNFNQPAGSSVLPSNPLLGGDSKLQTVTQLTASDSSDVSGTLTAHEESQLYSVPLNGGAVAEVSSKILSTVIPTDCNISSPPSTLPGLTADTSNPVPPLSTAK